MPGARGEDSADLIEVVEAKATLGDHLSIGGPCDRDLPDLLAATLVDWYGLAVKASESMRPKEVGGVVHTHRRHHAMFLRPYEGARRCQGFHHGGVQSGVHHPERLMMFLPHLDMPFDH